MYWLQILRQRLRKQTVTSQRSPSQKQMISLPTKRPPKVMRQKKKPQPHLRLQLMKRIRMNQAAPEYRRRKDFQRALA